MGSGFQEQADILHDSKGDRDKGSAFLDLNFQRNYFGVEVYIDMPEGCDYDLTLYDEYGNQVGKAEWDGEGRKKLTVPNWDINTNQYCLKVENGNGEEISPDDYYKISFHVTENKEQGKTDVVREAFGNLHGAYSRKDDNWREYLDRYNAVLKETEQNYIKEMERLHQKQFDGLSDRAALMGKLNQNMADIEKIQEADERRLRLLFGEPYEAEFQLNNAGSVPDGKAGDKCRGCGCTGRFRCEGIG